MNEEYPSGWRHATIHWNPKTGEIHSEGDYGVRTELIESLHKQIPGSVLVDVDGKAVLYVTLEIDEDMKFLA